MSLLEPRCAQNGKPGLKMAHRGSRRLTNNRNFVYASVKSFLKYFFTTILSGTILFLHRTVFPVTILLGTVSPRKFFQVHFSRDNIFTFLLPVLVLPGTILRGLIIYEKNSSLVIFPKTIYPCTIFSRQFFPK